MDGITILDAYTYANPTPLFWFIGFGLGFIVVAIFAGINLHRKLHAEAIVSIIISLVCLALAIVVHFTTPEPTTHYKVLVDDSVSFNEFMSKYEVVKQEGRIYTIVEKTNEG